MITLKQIVTSQDVKIKCLSKKYEKYDIRFMACNTQTSLDEFSTVMEYCMAEKDMMIGITLNFDNVMNCQFGTYSIILIYNQKWITIPYRVSFKQICCIVDRQLLGPDDIYCTVCKKIYDITQQNYMCYLCDALLCSKCSQGRCPFCSQDTPSIQLDNNTKR
jgi:hypothetical protein